MVTIAIMLAAFARLLVSDSVAPLILNRRWPPIITSVVGGGALGVFAAANRASRARFYREYFLVIALILGMAAGEITPVLEEVK